MAMPTRQSTLIERYAVVQFPKANDDDKCALARNLEDGLRQGFPGCCARNHTLWSFKIAADGATGTPKLDDLQMEEAVDLWEADEQAGARRPLWRVRVESGRVVVNYMKCLREDPGSFDEFQSLLDQVLPLCRAALRLPDWNVFLHYLFSFSADTISAPDLIRPDRIEVRDLLQPFAALPAPEGFEYFTPDYKWKQEWVQSVLGRTYVSSADIYTERAPRLAIHLDLGAGEERRPAKDTICKDLFQVLLGNAEKLFVPRAWNELRGDFA